QAKVEHFDLAARGDKNIGWLDIPMDDPFAVGRLQRACDLSSQPEHLLYRQGLAIHVLFERLTFEQLHDEELLPLVFSHVVNRADVRIVERGCGVCFTLEAPLRAGFHGETRRQNLDSDASFEARVSGAVNFAHPASANERFNSIWTQVGARRQVHGAANYRLEMKQSTVPMLSRR